MQQMTDEQRTRLGAMVRQTRIERYDTKMAAYQAAGVNPATWDRVEAGKSVKDHTLTTIIKLLWPSAGGDWRRVPGIFELPPVGFTFEGSHELTEHDRQMEKWVTELQDRIELLERHVYSHEGSPTSNDFVTEDDSSSLSLEEVASQERAHARDRQDRSE